MMKQNPILPGIGQSNTASKEGKSYLELREERKQNATALPKTPSQASFAQPASKSTSPNNNGKRTYLSKYSSVMKPTEAQYTNREKTLQGLSDADFISEVRTNGLGGRLPSMQNGKNMSGLMPNSFKRFQDTFVTKVDSTMKGVSKNLGGGQWLDAQSLYAIEMDINSLDRDFKVMKAAGYDIDDSVIGKYRDALKEARGIYGQYANAEEYKAAVAQAVRKEETSGYTLQNWQDLIDDAIRKGDWNQVNSYITELTQANLSASDRDKAVAYIDKVTDENYLQKQMQSQWAQKDSKVSKEARDARSEILFLADRGQWEQLFTLMHSEKGKKYKRLILQEYGIDADSAESKEGNYFGLASQLQYGNLYDYNTLTNSRETYKTQLATNSFRQRAQDEIQRAEKSHAHSAQMDSYVRAQSAYYVLNSLSGLLGVEDAGVQYRVDSPTQYLIDYLASECGVDLSGMTEANYRSMIRSAMQEQSKKAIRMGKILKSEGFDTDVVREYAELAIQTGFEGKRMEAFDKWNQNAGTGKKILTDLLMIPYRTGIEPLTAGSNLLAMVGEKGDANNPNKYVPMLGTQSPSDLVRSAASEAIEKNTNWEMFDRNVLSFLYNAGMSAADSAANAFSYGTFSILAMGTRAAGAEANDILARGGSREQAFRGGLAAGAIEAITEYVSVDKLLSAAGTIDSLKALFKSAASQAFTEGTEEMSSEILNIIVDSVNMGNLSRNSQAVKAYMDDLGMSYDAARQKVLYDNIGKVVESGVSGFLSGGFSGGTKSTAAYIDYRTQKKAIDLLGNVDENTDAYKICNALHTAGADMTEDNRIGIMVELVLQGASQEDADHISNVVKKAVNGKQLSSQEKSLLKKNPLVGKVLRSNLQRANPETQTISAPERTETEVRADVVQAENPKATVVRSESVQAYIDTGKVTLKNAQKASAVLDAIVSGEKTELTTNEIDSLMLTTTAGSEVASKILGIEVPRFAEKATARTQFRSIVNQYMQTRAESQNTAAVATEQPRGQIVQPDAETSVAPTYSAPAEAYESVPHANEQFAEPVMDTAPEAASTDSDFVAMSTGLVVPQNQDADVTHYNEVHEESNTQPRMGYTAFAEKYRQYFNKNATDNELGTAYHRYSNPNEYGEYHGVRPSTEVFNLPVETVRAIDELGKLFGLDISFEDLGKDNGYYMTGTNKVVMDIKPMKRDADSAFLFTASHELGHAIRDRIGAEAWSAFEKYAVAAMGGEKAVQAKQKQNAVYKNPTEAREDVACDFLGKLMSDKNTLDTFCKAVEKGQFNAEYAKGIGGLMQKIVDRINSAKLSKAIRKRWGKDIANAKNAAQAILKAADAALKVKENTAENVGSVKKSFKGYDPETGRGIYEANFPKGTPKSQKAAVILDYIQNVWSKKPISLIITNKDGSTRKIKAEFDPTYDPNPQVRTDASKLMGGNRQGTSSDQRVTLDLASDYYQILSESVHNYSKDETGKKSATHKDVTQWHYFVNDIFFIEYGEEEARPYGVTINIKEKPNGTFVYSYSAELQEKKGTNTRQTLHADVTPTENSGGNVHSHIDKLTETAGKVNTQNAEKVAKPDTDDTYGENHIVQEAGIVKYSRKYDDQYMEKAERYNAKSKAVPDEVMEQARKDRTRVKTRLAEMESKGVILPADNEKGSKPFSNSSYGGVSEENTSICVRSLALEDLVNLISEATGRPLTVEEQLYISQYVQTVPGMNAPECTYCYVAADRKAYREYLGEYIKQRDAVIEAYKNGETEYSFEGKYGTGLYEKFLNKRKNTEPMQKCFQEWISLVESGKQLISPADVANLAKLDGDLTEFHKDLIPQIKDAMKYAQAASLAKKRVGFIAYNGHILKWKQSRIDALNSQFGLRMYSFSDFSPAFILENMQMFTDAAVKGLKVLAYTKELAFAKIFAPTCANINVSVFGFEKDGVVAENAMMGAPWEEVKALRAKYKNVGTVFVATSDNLVNWALEQDWIDVVIPYHLVRTGRTIAQIMDYMDYTDESSDTKEMDWKSDDGEVSGIYPTMHHNDKETYLAELKKNRLQPRFKRFLDNPNYMKLVNETRQSDIDTEPVQPIFDMEAVDVALGQLELDGYYTPIGGTVDRMEQIALGLTDDISSGKSQQWADEKKTEPKRNFRDGKVKKSIKDTFYEEASSWLESTSISDMTVAGGYFEIGMTSDALKSIGVRDGKIYWRKSKIGYIMMTHSEMDKSTILNVPQILENPVIVTKSLTSDDSLLVFGYVEGANKDVVSAVLNLTPLPAGGMEAEFTLLASAYSRSDGNIRNLINNNSEIAYIDPDKKRTDAWLMSLGLQLPSDQSLPGSVGRITYTDGKVNISGKKISFADVTPSPRPDEYKPKKSVKTNADLAQRDADYMAAVKSGDMETAQRMVDEAANNAMPDTVVRDSNGNLLTMYHGTSDGGYTVFDTYGSNFGLFGQGSYFTDNEDVAESYTEKGKGSNKQVYKTFLNITNPIDMDATANMDRWEKAFRGADLDISYLDDADTNEDCFRAMKEALIDEGYYKYEAWEAIASAFIGMGYDGITHIGGGRFNSKDSTKHRVYVVFDPEQIKSADPVTYDDNGNVIPLSERFNEKKTDIRYSKKDTGIESYEADYGTEIRKTGLANAKIPSYDELVKKADIQIVDIRHNSESIKELKKKFKGSEAYLEMMNAPVDNYDTNTSIFFSNKSYSHSLSNPGEEQIQALYHLRKIVQNAVLTHKEPSKKAPDDNCIGVYTFFGAVRSEKGIQPVKLKVKEYEIVGQAIPETVQKYLLDVNDMVDYALLYDGRVLLIEDIEKEDVSSSAASTNANSAKADNYPSTSSTIRIADLINLVNGKSLLYIPKKKISSKIPTPEEARYLERYRVAEEQNRIEKENALKQAVTRDIVSKAIGSPNSTSKKHSIKTIDELVDEFGSIPTGENPTRTVEIPNRTTSDTKVRRTVRTAMEAAVTPDSMIPLIEDRIIEGSFGYNPVTNKQRMQSAYEWVESRDIGSALNEWLLEVGSGKLTADLSARGMLLYNNYVNASATETNVDEMKKAERNAADILAALSSLTTVGAQITQFNRMLKKLSPETQIYALERNVKKLQETINRELEALKRPKIELKLNSEWMEMWAKELRRGPLADSDFLYSIEGVIFADIAKQVPKRFIDKWNAWRYLSMLGNPKTLVRNTFGNALFMPAKALKDAIGTGLERIFIKDTSQRTKALKGDKDVKQFAKQDYKSSDVKRLLDTGNGKYSMENIGTRLEKAIRDAHRNFDAWGLRHWQKATNYIMNDMRWFSDSAFMSHHYETSFARIAKARGITAKMLSDGAVNQETLDEMRAYAVNEALKATYKDVNAVSKFMSKLKSKNKIVNLALEGIVPFRATPANVMVRAVEYSPVGLIKAVTADLYKVQKGQISSSEYLDRLSSGLSGTAIWGLGWLLASMGMIRIGADDDEKREGKQNYSLEIGDWSITLDWVAPASIPFFMGASMRTILGADDGANFLDAVMDATSTFFAPMLEMSMLSGMQDLLDTFTYGDGFNFGQMMMAFFVQPFFSYVGQAVPTILGQLANTFEPNRTTTYVGDITGQVSKNVVRMIAKISEKIPFVDWRQMDYVDTFGRKDPNGPWYARVLNNFFNPAYVNKINVTDPDAEIRRLEEVTGEEISPKRPDYSITVTQYDAFGKKLSSEKIALTADQFEAYSTAYGQQYVLMMTEMMASTFYDTLSDEEKVEAISEIDQLAKEYGKIAAGVGYRTSPESSQYKILNLADKQGIPIAEIYGVKLYKDQLAKDDMLSTEDRKSKLVQMISGVSGWSEDQKAAVFSYAIAPTVPSIGEHKPSSEQKASYADIYGRYASEVYESIVPSAQFASLPDEEKSAMIDKASDLVSFYAKREWASKHSIKSDSYDPGTVSHKYDTLIDAGFSFFDAYTIESKYKEISNNKDAYGGNVNTQSTAFNHWVNGQKWSTSQKQAALATYDSFWSNQKGTAEKYNDLRSLGFSDDLAKAVRDRVTSLPDDSNDQKKLTTAISTPGMTDKQKWDYVINSLKGDSKSGTRKKFQNAKNAGFACESYVKHYYGINALKGEDLDNNGKTDTNSRKKKVADYIRNAYGLTEKQKDHLWIEQYSSESPGGWKTFGK